jgi:hypothetical protein
VFYVAYRTYADKKKEEESYSLFCFYHNKYGKKDRKINTPVILYRIEKQRDKRGH